jgi:hypothetical protein
LKCSNISRNSGTPVAAVEQNGRQMKGVVIEFSSLHAEQEVSLKGGAEIS